MGGDCGHIKAYGLALFTYQREFLTEGLLGRHALGMLGRTLITYCKFIPRNVGSFVHAPQYYTQRQHCESEILSQQCTRWYVVRVIIRTCSCTILVQGTDHNVIE